MKDGESIAITYLAKALQEAGHQLDLLAMNTVKHYYDARQLPAEMNHYTAIHTVDVDTRIKPLDAFLTFFY